MRIIILLITLSILSIGCDSTFTHDETGKFCSDTGIVYSSNKEEEIGESNYFLPQYYQLDENSTCLRRRCLDGQWVVDPDYVCEYSCKKPVEENEINNPNFNYCGFCNNKEQRCKDNIVQICENGRWIDQTNCMIEFQTSCIKIDDIASCGACLNGDERFYNNPNGVCKHTTCEDAKWILDEDYCGNSDVSCNPTLDGCGECLNEEMKCDGKVIFQCSSGSWKAKQPCDYSCSQIIDNNNIQYVCGECNNGDIKHWNHLGKGICESAICENGKWKNYDDCSLVSCVYEKNESEEDTFSQCGECINETKQCIGKEYKLCKNGKFITLFTCDSCDENSNVCIKPCTLNQCTQETDLIATFCRENQETHLPEIVFCPAGCTSDNICKTCNNDEQVFKEEIINNKDTCYYRLCQNNLFPDEYTKCTNSNNEDVSCYNNKNNELSCGECQNGKIKCQTSNSSCKCHECRNGQWEFLCENSLSCLGTETNYTGCGVCKNGDMKYTQDRTTCYQSKCINGKWSSNEMCSGGNSCKVKNNTYSGCGECVNGNYYTEASGICNYTSCTNGVKNNTPQRCPNSYSCTKTNGKLSGCGVCQNNKTKCEQSRLFTCKDGAWPTEGTFCPKGCNSEGTKCK
ncbi:MAG: hypothetical protein IJU23_09455 [Proteobacteria bacterium]|nr:hypothetical protein [Pseudomonadota bacterium]